MRFFGETKHDPGGTKYLPMLPGVQGDAVFLGPNDCHRIMLDRWWGPSRHGPSALFIGMNPSTAGAHNDDPTIRKEMAVSNRLGVRVYHKANVTPYRATHPEKLKAITPSILSQPENESAILECALRVNTQIVVMACGDLADVLIPIARGLVEQLRASKIELFCMGTTKQGHPRHPLFLRTDTPLVPWNGQF